MPSIQNLVSDSANRLIQDFSTRTGVGHLLHSSLISGRCRVNYLYSNTASLTNGNRVVCQVATSTDINGAYLRYGADTSAIARIGVLRPIVNSESFSGCSLSMARTLIKRRALR